MYCKMLKMLMIVLAVSMPLKAAEMLALPQAIQMALQHRTEMKSAKLSSERAILGLSINESQLGWQANVSSGWKHGLDMFGQPTEQQRLSAGLKKQQHSGNQISIQGSYQKDESDITGASLFPNPMESYGVNLDYRLPLQKGKDNPAYSYSEAQAKMAIAVSSAEQRATADRIGEQLITIYHRLLDLQIQTDENHHAIERTRKLTVFIKKNSRLGMAEEKDLLSVQARMAAQRADEKRLQREWTSQFSELQNMVGSIHKSVRLKDYHNSAAIPVTLAEVLTQVIKRDAIIEINKEKLAITESLLQLNRDSQKNQLDLVLSVGNETRQGQRAGGVLDKNEWVGGLRLEYQLPLDRRGMDARTRQSLIEIDQIRIDNRRYEADLKSLLHQWYQEWQIGVETIQQYQRLKTIENLKYKEVKNRYLQGRTNIREMLEAEESLSTAERLLASEKARRSLVLALLSNRLGNFKVSDRK